MTHSLELAGESVEFHPWGGLYWPAQSTLLLSDLHLGKVMHFRKYGAAVPREALLRNLTASAGFVRNSSQGPCVSSGTCSTPT